MKNVNIKRVRNAAILLVGGLGIGFIVGFMINKSAPQGPSAVAIAKGFATPLPVPDGTTLAMSGGGSSHYIEKNNQLDFSSARSFAHSVTNFGQDQSDRLPSWENWCAWHCTFTLDVTSLTPEQIQAIPAVYQAWFRDHVIPTSPAPGNWDSVPWEYEEPGIRNELGQWPPYGGYPGWSWRRGYRYDTAHLHCEIHVELMDYDIDQNSTRPRFPVPSLDAPVQGRRFMYVVLSVNGVELSK